MQDLGRRIHEHRSHQDQQQHREHEHHALGGVAKIIANQIRQTGAVVTHGEHTRQIVVHRTSEDAAEDNPQIGHRTELRTHDGTKDRTSSRNVQKLDHEDLPVWKHNVVQAVGLSHSRRHTVIWPKHLLHKASV